MRIFIQISVGGFKIFDIESFIHDQNDLKYINIAEIRNVEQTRTYLVNNDLHGLRSEICGLFSNGDIEVLLQNDTFDTIATSILFIKRFGHQDESLTDEKISALFVSETSEETNFLRNLTIARISDDERTGVLLYELLTKRIIDNKQVIAFDNAAWKDLIIYIENKEFSDHVESILARSNQMILLHNGINPFTIIKRFPGLLNKQLYNVFSPNEFSKIKNGGKLNEPICVIPEEMDFSTNDKDLKSKAQNLLKSVFDHVANKLDNYSDKLK